MIRLTNRGKRSSRVQKESHRDLRPYVHTCGAQDPAPIPSLRIGSWWLPGNVAGVSRNQRWAGPGHGAERPHAEGRRDCVCRGVGSYQPANPAPEAWAPGFLLLQAQAGRSLRRPGLPGVSLPPWRAPSWAGLQGKRLPRRGSSRGRQVTLRPWGQAWPLVMCTLAQGLRSGLLERAGGDETVPNAPP